MKSFLRYTAEKITLEMGEDIDNAIIIFPNRRPIIFLKEELKKAISTTVFMPQIMCIDDWVSQLSDWEMTDNMFLMFELFRIHCEIGNPKYRTFEEFIPFADMLLKDFSEIDAYCVDARKLFANIHDIKAIGEWDVEGGELTEFQKKYLEFYKSLYSYYTKLKDSLEVQRKGYPGMIYRKVAENIEDYISRLAGKKIYFVGFNALNYCEEKIIKPFIENGMGTIITDGDDYYFKDKQQEAGNFLRQLREKGFIKCDEEYGDFFGNGEKKITVISCPENVLQVKETGLLLDNLENYNDTAVVLADESLLIPMLNSLPTNLDKKDSADRKVNVTMGFPYTYSLVHNFITDLFNLHINRKNNSFYYKDVINILSNTFVQTIAKYKDIKSIINTEIYKLKKLYITIDDLSDIGKADFEKIKFLFNEDASSPKAFLVLCEDVINQLFDMEKFLEKELVREQVALSSFAKIINHFKDLSDKYDFVSNLNTLYKIYSKISRYHRIPFKGEPLENLQILGMLETRSLDFKNVFLLSANEGRLPQGKNLKSLIPISLKRAFGIRTYSENDSIFAYYFYRLLQRSTNMYILYNSDSEGDGKGDPSRFITQIKEELVPKYKNITFAEKTLAVKINTANVESVTEVAKTDEIMSILKRIATSKSGFSPSSLNTYRKCPLKYYYENVLNIRETKKPTEDIDTSELGNTIHEILEDIFKKYEGQKVFVSKEYLNEQLQNLHEQIKDIETIKLENRGKGFLFREIAEKQIRNFITKQIKDIDDGKKISIEELERALFVTMQIGDTEVKITGKIDRVDIINNKELRIIDYKSGGVDESDLKGNVKEVDIVKLKDKWFQLMVYAWLYRRNCKNDYKIMAGIYPLRNFSSDFMKIQITDNGKKYSNDITDSALSEFENILMTVVEEILNKDVPFVKRKNNECAYCQFVDKCNLGKK